MKKILLLIFMTGLSLSPYAQKLFFIYMQTEGGQAFYLRMDEKVWSSTAQGYLILPKLHDSTYTFTIGFPQNKYPDQPFTVPMASKDHGFLLKDFGVKGWGLFDLQTMTVIMNNGGGALQENKIRRMDSGATAFTRILAKAVDDPGLLEIPDTPAPEKTVVAVNKPADPVLNPVMNQDTIARKELVLAEKKKEENPVSAELKKPDTVPAVKSPDIPKDTITTAPVVQTDPVVQKDTLVTAVSVSADPVKIQKESPVHKDSVVTTITVTEVKAEPAKDPPIPLLNKDSLQQVKPDLIAEKPVLKSETEKKAESFKDTVQQQMNPGTDQPYVRSVVKKKSESSTTEGFGLVFIDEYPNGQADTIRILIPNVKPAVKVVTEQPVPEKKFLDIAVNAADTVVTKVKTDSVQVKQPLTESIKENKLTAPEVNDTVLVKPADSLVSKPVTDTAVQVAVQSNNVVSPNKNCADAATDADFLKLRKKMAAVEGNDEMISEARKYFKLKCFSTVQIKNLSALFLDDEGKYHFLDEAYDHVTDPDQYGSLQDELKDDYFKNRFRAMLRH